jgi:hypothetical protein
MAMAVRRINLPDEMRAALATPAPTSSTPNSPALAPALDATTSATPPALAAADYTAAFELLTPEPTTRPPEDWARAVFEGAPAALRRFIRTGWRFPLGFQLGPVGSPAHVLGCRIIRVDRTMIVLEQRSPLMTAHNIVFVDRTRIVWTTLVRYQHPLARPLWSVSAALHRRILPHLLTQAAHA